MHNLILLLPPFLTGIIIILTHIPLGIEASRREIVFVNIAFAQFSALGIMFADNFLVDSISSKNTIEQICAVIFAVGLAAFLSFTEKKFPKKQEAIIGSSFIFATSLCLIMLNPSQVFPRILAGEILWVTQIDVVRLALIYALLFLVILILKKGLPKKYKANFALVGFSLLFAVVIAESVHLAGIVLVFSFLIMPVFVSSPFTHPYVKILASYLVAVLALILGLIISSGAGIETGPTISLTALIFVALAYFTNKKYGAQIRIWLEQKLNQFSRLYKIDSGK